MSSLWPSVLSLHAPLALQLQDGTRLKGTLEMVDGEWLLVDCAGARVAIAKQQIAVLGYEGRLPTKGAGSGKKAPASAAAPATAELDETIVRQLLDGFLDGHSIETLMQISGLGKKEVKLWHQAFECARGNLVDDQIPPAARALLPQLRSVFSQ